MNTQTPIADFARDIARAKRINASFHLLILASKLARAGQFNLSNTAMQASDRLAKA